MMLSSNNPTTALTQYHYYHHHPNVEETGFGESSIVNTICTTNSTTSLREPLLLLDQKECCTPDNDEQLNNHTVQYIRPLRIIQYPLWVLMIIRFASYYYSNNNNNDPSTATTETAATFMSFGSIGMAIGICIGSVFLYQRCIDDLFSIDGPLRQQSISSFTNVITLLLLLPELVVHIVLIMLLFGYIRMALYVVLASSIVLSWFVAINSAYMLVRNYNKQCKTYNNIDNDNDEHQEKMMIVDL